MGDFTEKTEVLKKTMAEIADSINTIAHAIEEGVKGVSSAADSTQVLVGDMEDITRHMDAVSYTHLDVYKRQLYDRLHAAYGRDLRKLLRRGRQRSCLLYTSSASTDFPLFMRISSTDEVSRI